MLAVSLIAFIPLPLGRTVENLDHGWRYVRVPERVAAQSLRESDPYDLSGIRLDSVKRAELLSVSPGDWKSATLPHAPWTRPLRSTAIWRGVTYYRGSLTAETAVRERRAILTIEAAMQVSDLWLNGEHVASRRGGYLPLVVDLSKRLKASNSLLVRVDNRDNPLVPPGKPQRDLDFVYGCGLYRHAYLTVTNALHVTDPMVENIPAGGGIYATTTQAGPASATVRVRAHIRNGRNVGAAFIVRQSLKDPLGRVVAIAAESCRLPAGAAATSTVDLQIERPRLWSPDSPSLYRLETSVVESGAETDRVVTKIGIRTVVVSRAHGFVLNGNPLRLVGTNRHQDYPWIGIALSDQSQYRDAILIKRSGHNIVRLSHYPQSPAFLDACDELGIMTIPCIAGWQFWNDDARFQTRTLQDIRELIRRDRNHPSAVLWEASLNETYPPVSRAQEWNDVAKAESVDGRILTAGDAGTGQPWDVAYNGWVDADMSRPQDALPSRPGYIREYGDYEFGGTASTSRVRSSDGEAALVQQAWNHVWSLNRTRPQYPWTMGEGTWEMFDQNVPYAPGVSACGLCDLFRRPKPTFWFFASQEAKQPMVRFATAWNGPPKDGAVVAFTNCEEVSLMLNGAQVARIRPSPGASTPYAQARPFDGSNSANLVHPPVVFRGVRFRPGRLTVVGYIDHRPVCQDEARTAGPAVRLALSVDDLGIPTRSGGDVVFVRAKLVDAHGTVVPTNGITIRFQVTGSGSVAGESVVLTEMGVASTLLRSSDRPGRVVVAAFGPGRLSGRNGFATR